MMLYFIVALANLLVGGMIGMAGVAGFLLPILYSGFLGLPLADSLALSFLAFLTSGLIGTWRYHRQGRLKAKAALPLCAGSLVGALAGVQLNQLIPISAAKVLLYVVVLASGLSLLLKKEREGTSRASTLWENLSLKVMIGFVTAAICSLTGAGGPILMVPVLALLGLETRDAVAIALMDSLAIALPAAIGYLPHRSLPYFGALALVTILFHGLGTIAGTALAQKAKPKHLRLGVGILAVGAAAYMLVRLALGGR